MLPFIDGMCAVAFADKREILALDDKISVGLFTPFALDELEVVAPPLGLFNDCSSVLISLSDISLSKLAMRFE